MLVLSRKWGERIIVGDDIVITLVEIERGKVKIGIEATPSVTIHREEVYRAIQSENHRKEQQRAQGDEAGGGGAGDPRPGPPGVGGG